MIRVDEVRARIEERVPALAGRIGTAGEFARLVGANQLPQQTPAAFVLPGALAGGAATAGTGLFRQSFAEGVNVVLVVRVAGDATGARGVDEITPLIRAVVTAVVGWVPDGALGTFVLGHGDLVGTEAGSLVYQLDFTLDDQLRIST